MRTKKILAFAAATFILAACSNDEEAFVNSNFPEDGVIRVATNVDAPTSRAGVKTDNLTSFYMDVVNDNNTTYSYFVQMRKEATSWNSYDGVDFKQMLWQNETTPIKVTAVALENSNFTKADIDGKCNLSVMADQSIAEGTSVAANDLVGMSQTIINPASADPNLVEGKIRVTLKHMLAKLNIKVTLRTEFNMADGGTATNPITELTVNGTKLGYAYTAKTTAVELPEPSSDAQSVKAYAATYTPGVGSTTKAVANYECILVPQEIGADAFSVRMMINGRVYEWTSAAAVTLEQSHAYTLELTAGKDVVIANTFSAAPWSTEGTEDKETEYLTD